jgi:hypothetical protein
VPLGRDIGIRARHGGTHLPDAACGDERRLALVYLDRMTQAGVTLREGDCYDGRAGDTSWIPGDGEDFSTFVEYRGQRYNAERVGCFLNENGIANVRLTCGGAIYIGVLGRNEDLAGLSEWIGAFAPYAPRDIPSPPGICFGTDGLLYPDTEP